MKIKEGFELQNVCGEYLIISAGEENVDFSKIISLNESAAYLWEHLQALPSFDVDNMVELLMQEYDVEHSIAREDCEAMLERWLEVGLVEE
ncbi:MAG: PqqD family protein [Bacteroidaceae bacterium]|nr:PqqD family protein [Bacteroidaceae bacterium]